MPLARLAAALAAFLLAAPVTAQPAPERPRLVVAISVDQLSSDVFAQFRQHFTGGFVRLLSGAVFPSGYQAHAATETCPGHATILTGAHPARSGVIANNWFDLDVGRDDVRVYCSEDPSVAGSTSEDYSPSPTHLLVPTLGDLLDAANPATRVMGVAGKDRSAIMMTGQDADQVWFPGRGGLATYDGAGSAPQAIVSANAAFAAALAEPRAADEAPAPCAPLVREVRLGPDHSVGTSLFARPAGNARALLTSPDADRLILQAGLGLVDEFDLGRGEAVDVLALGLAATDYIGHAYGTTGAEMCAQMLALDRALGDFFLGLEERGINYVAVLTADHGGLDLPERQTAQAAPGAHRLGPGFESINEELAEAMGLEAPVIRSDGPLGDFYIDRSVPEDRRGEARDRAIALISAHPDVYRVFARDEILAQPVVDAPPENWTVLDRVRASYHPDRSGDFVVVLQPRVTPIPNPRPGIVATHGSVWDYDRRVPILFWWPGAEQFEQPLGVMTVDIMPTLASLIGLDISHVEIDGRCLDLLPGAEESNCP